MKDETNDILELNNMLMKNKIVIDISVTDCNFLNTIYLPSKYPGSSVLADYTPDQDTCEYAIAIADRVLSSIKKHLE